MSAIWRTDSSRQPPTSLFCSNNAARDRTRSISSCSVRWQPTLDDHRGPATATKGVGTGSPTLPIESSPRKKRSQTPPGGLPVATPVTIHPTAVLSSDRQAEPIVEHVEIRAIADSAREKSG